MLNKLKGANYHIQDFHSAILSGSTAAVQNKASFLPDFWLVVARFSLGYLRASTGGSPGGAYVRIDQGTLVLPFRADLLTIETVGASGFWDAYAVHNLDSFDVKG